MSVALSKMKKAELLEFLEASKEVIDNKDLLSEVNDMIDRKHKKAEIYEIAQMVKTQVEDLAPIENSLKKATKEKDVPKKAPKKAPKKKDSDDKPAKKKVTKKKKTSGIKIKTETVEMSFPETFELDGIGEVRVNRKIESIEDAVEAFEAEKDMIFATLWTKTHIKKYDYDRIGLGASPKSFPENLDLLAPVFVSENIAYAVSMYTDMVFYFKPESFEVDDNGARVATGMEWVLLEPVEEE